MIFFHTFAGTKVEAIQQPGSLNELSRKDVCPKELNKLNEVGLPD